MVKKKVVYSILSFLVFLIFPLLVVEYFFPGIFSSWVNLSFLFSLVLFLFIFYIFYDSK